MHQDDARLMEAEIISGRSRNVCGKNFVGDIQEDPNLLRQFTVIRSYSTWRQTQATTAEKVVELPLSLSHCNLGTVCFVRVI